MKYLSEVTEKVYDTVDELNADEEKVLTARKERELAEAEKKAKREERAKEVEEALKFALEAQKEANEKLEAFCKDYGTFHTSLKNADMVLGNYDPFRNFFKTFWGF
jgi:septal ring factor EnvC (AmiA/AmiB activator)